MGQSYRDLIAWQKAMDFVMDVYRTSKDFRGTSFTDSPANCEDQRLGSRPTLQRGRHVSPPMNSITSWGAPEDPWSKSKPNS